MPTTSPSPRSTIRVSGKHALLVLLGGMALLIIALYWVIIPMHFGGKERIQQEYDQSQPTPAEPANESTPTSASGSP